MKLSIIFAVNIAKNGIEVILEVQLGCKYIMKT